MISSSKSNGATTNIRFVVGAFGSVEQVVQTVESLRKSRSPPNSIGIVAKHSILLHGAGRLPLIEVEHVPKAEVAFFAAHEDKIVCMGGTLGRLLRERALAGCKGLGDALRHWLLPRHAKALSDVVEKDGILILAEVRDLEEERTASLSFLRDSRGSVEVHDFPTTR